MAIQTGGKYEREGKMDKKKYWHEVTDEEYNSLIKKKVTIKYVVKNYLPPEWCNMPNAIHPKLGCWMLVKRKVTKEKCKDCGMFKNV